MHTIIQPISKELIELKNKGIEQQVLMRTTHLNKWFDIPNLADRLSGTLRKSHRIGFKTSSLLEHEAICQTLGWGFESMASTRVNFNDALAEGDCKSMTEVGWHYDRMLSINIFPEDKFELKYLNIQDEAGNFVRQGIGIIVRETSIQWVKPGKLIFALLTEYNLKTCEWTDCINPF